MSKHTPGPWYTGNDGIIWRRNPNELYQNGGEIAGEMMLAQAYKGWDGKKYVGYPVEANARLIAAAPDLLETAKAVVERWDSPLWREQEHTSTFINRLRAAIAKAEGGTP